MARAMSSLPVPVSPRIRTVAGVGGDAANLLVDGSAWRGSCRRWPCGRRGFAHSTGSDMRRPLASGLGGQVEQFFDLEGFDRGNRRRPILVASMAVSVVPWAVIR